MDGRHPEGREAAARVVGGGDGADVRLVRVRDVDGHGEVVLLRRREVREEVGVEHEAVPLERLRHHAHRTVLLHPRHPVDGGVEVGQREDGGPAQASAGLLPCLGHPAVPRLAECAVHLRTLRHVADPERVVEYLDVHAQPVHVRKAQRDVVEGAGLFGRDEVASCALRHRLQLALDRRRGAESCDASVDHPIATGRPLRVRKEERAELLVRLVEVVPRLLALDDVRVRVDSLVLHRRGHVLTPLAYRCLLNAASIPHPRPADNTRPSPTLACGRG